MGLKISASLATRTWPQKSKLGLSAASHSVAWVSQGHGSLMRVKPRCVRTNLLLLCRFIVLPYVLRQEMVHMACQLIAIQHAFSLISCACQQMSQASCTIPLNNLQPSPPLPPSPPVVALHSKAESTGPELVLVDAMGGVNGLCAQEPSEPCEQMVHQCLFPMYVVKARISQAGAP